MLIQGPVVRVHGHFRRLGLSPSFSAQKKASENPSFFLFTEKITFLDHLTGHMEDMTGPMENVTNPMEKGTTL